VNVDKLERLSRRHIVRLYKMNRLWGDTVIEAAYWALRGKAFTVSFQGRLVEQQIDQSDTEDDWWQAIK
jgi:hypothetical protein